MIFRRKMEKVQSLLDTASGVLGFGGDPLATLVGSKVIPYYIYTGTYILIFLFFFCSQGHDTSDVPYPYDLELNP